MSNSLRSRVNKLAYQGHITKKDAEMIREALIKQRGNQSYLKVTREIMIYAHVVTGYLFII